MRRGETGKKRGAGRAPRTPLFALGWVGAQTGRARRVLSEAEPAVRVPRTAAAVSADAACPASGVRCNIDRGTPVAVSIAERRFFV